MAQRQSRSPSEDSSGSRSGSASEDEEEPFICHIRAELTNGHRPVVVSEVPVYVALRDKDGRNWMAATEDGRNFEDRGNCPHVRYRWMRGPVIKPCVFHPHKTSQFRDVTKTFQHYCAKDCFLRGWHSLPRSMWGARPEPDQFEEPIAEWMEVANVRQYCPSQNDIDRPLRLDIIPLLKDGRDCARKHSLSVTTGTVIPTPKEARTRRMISNGGTFNAEWLSQQFKVMNWNVLADLYATEPVYPYCEKWALSWTWRKHLILKELRSMAADIITLQEVQKDAYDDWFRPQLAESGYEGIFQQKKRQPIFHHGKYIVEGCATFYKTTRFRRVNKQVVDYDKLSAEALCPQSSENAARGLQRLSKGNIALAVILEDLHTKTSHSSQAAGPTGGHMLCVVNTHILADPLQNDVKLWQVHLLLRTLEQTPNKSMPLLVSGDFNSTPESAVYEYMRQGTVRNDHADLQLDPVGLLKHLAIGHSLRVATAYETCDGREAPYTNYTEDFKDTLDYIWFSSDTLAVLAISQVDDESQLAQETALPSSTRPSDHVSLVATFMFRDVPADPPASQQAASQQAVGSHLQLSGSSQGQVSQQAYRENSLGQSAAAHYHNVSALMANQSHSLGDDGAAFFAAGQHQWAQNPSQYPARGFASPWN